MGYQAYVVVSSTYTFQQTRRTLRETGTIAFAPVKQSIGWLEYTGVDLDSREAEPVEK